MTLFRDNGRRPAFKDDHDIHALPRGNTDDLDLSSLPCDREQPPLRITISFPPSCVYRFETIKRTGGYIELVPPSSHK